MGISLNRRVKRAGAATAMTAAAVLGFGAQPAFADTPFSWGSGNPLIGCGGQVSGGYVIAVQSIVGTYGTYWSYIDSQYGSLSLQAVRNFQSGRGLKSDGCVGPDTWANMQLLIHYVGDEACPYGTLHEYNYAKGSLQSSFGRATAWTSATLNPVASPVQANKEYLQTQPLTIIC